MSARGSCENEGLRRVDGLGCTFAIRQTVQEGEDVDLRGDTAIEGKFHGAQHSLGSRHRTGSWPLLLIMLPSLHGLGEPDLLLVAGLDCGPARNLGR